MPLKTLAARIRLARQAARMTQTQLAHKLGVSRSAVAQWESLLGAAPATTNLGKLALALHCSFEWLATARGSRGIGRTSTSEDAAEVAVALRHFARDDDEEHVLSIFRQLQTFDRTVAIALLEQLSVRPAANRKSRAK